MNLSPLERIELKIKHNTSNSKIYDHNVIYTLRNISGELYCTAKKLVGIVGPRVNNT